MRAGTATRLRLTARRLLRACWTTWCVAGGTHLLARARGSRTRACSRATQVGRPLFLALYDYFKAKGGIYKLAFGPKTFMIVSDPVIAKVCTPPPVCF